MLVIKMFIGLRAQQHRHFYVRFKSSISPGKKQLSRYGGTVVCHALNLLDLFMNVYSPYN